MEKRNPDSLGYKGEVTVSIVRDGRTLRSSKKRNKGLGPLFKFLVDSIGNDFSQNYAPRYLRAFHASGDGWSSRGEETTMEAVPAVLQEKEYADDSASITMSFVIPGSWLIGKETNMFAVYGLANATSQKTANASAYVYDETAVDDESLTNGSNVVVAWKMTLSNNNVEGE